MRTAELHRALDLTTVPGDLVDKQRDQRLRQGVPHPRNNSQAGPGNIGRGILSSGQWDQGIVGAVQDKGRRANGPSFLARLGAA